MQSVNMRKAGKQSLVLLGLCVLLLMVPFSVGAASEDGGGVLRSRVYNLRHINSEQGRDLFSRLNIGKSYNTLTGDVLIITSDVGSDLVRATEIVDVLDQTPPVEIRTLAVASESRPLPELDMFLATLGSVSAGTMTEAPPKSAENPVIVDILDDELIAIAGEEALTQVEAAYKDWEQKHPAPVSDTPPAVTESVTAAPSKEKEEQLQVLRALLAQAEEEPKLLEAVADPNVPELAPEPNDLPNASVEAVASPVAQAPSTTADANEPVAEAASEVPETVSEPNQPADAPPQDNEDFLSAGLLQELAEAEQAAQVQKELDLLPQAAAETETTEASETEPEPADGVPETAAAEEPVQEPAETPKDPMEVIRTLMAQAKADEAKVLAAQKAAAEAERAEPEKTEASKPEPVDDSPKTMAAEELKEEPIQEADALQAELALLRQKLVELEARAEGDKAPAPLTAIESSKEVPADAATSKIQTTKTAQTQPQLDPKLSDKELDTVIDLPQDVELESLVDLVGKQLGLNYLYDPAILKGQKVKLKVHGGRIKVSETYALLESVLRQKGFVMTRRGRFIMIFKANDANAINKVGGDLLIRDPGDPIPPGTLVVSTKFKLDHIDPASAKSLLTLLQLGMTNGYKEIAATNTLIVTDYAYRMDQVENALEMIDVAGEKKEYEFRTLKHINPSEIVPKLQELAKQLEGVSLQISAPSAAPAAKTRTVTTRDPKTGRTTTKQVPVTTAKPSAPAAQKAQPDAVYIDTDDRTNRILMAGKVDQLTLINELIDALDVPQYDLKVVREYIIENVEAAEVIDVLNELGLATVAVPTAQTPSRMTSRATSTTTRTTAARTPSRTSTPTSKTAAPDQPNISVRPETNSLLVNATEEQHAAIELVIAHVDVVQKDQRTIRQYEIQYVDTQEIIETLTDLEIIAPQQTSRDSSRSSSTRSSRSTMGRSTQPQAGAGAETAAPLSLPTVGGGSEKDITADQPQISVLETTNSLLVYATPRQHDAIALVIAHADRTPETTSTPYVVYALENQDPLELAEVLTKLIQETVEEVKQTSTPTSKIQTSGGTSTAAKLPTLEEQNIRVIPDEMSYSLIVYANKRNQQWIAELIRELDEYRPQVLLDCTLVEITQDESFKYDMDIVSKTYSGLTLQPGSPIGTIGGADFSASRLAEGRSSSGSFTGFFNSEMIQALLETVQTNGYGRIMARPKILVNDNQEGEITTKNTTAIAQVKSNVIPGGTGGAATVSTTDVSFTDYDEGVTLNIKPHISQGEMLRLEILLNRTDFTLKPDVKITGTEGDATFPSPPDRLSTDVTTVATVPDGTTIILGGLESLDQSKTHSKVPILGDLPLIGVLFRGIDNMGDQGRLYVFVKANIIRPGDQVEGLEDIRRVSAKNRDQFEEMEEKFQDLRDFPGINPPPMDPVKVLEEDDFESEGVSEDGFVVQDSWPTE